MMQLSSTTAPLLQARTAKAGHVRAFARHGTVQRVVKCAAAGHEQVEDAGSTRRAVLLSLTAAAVLARAPVSLAEEDVAEFKTLYGMATPPTSYGGYGGNRPNEKPKYSFIYPATWKQDTINKTDKGTQGVDSRVINPRSPKQERIFVITLSRAGEDAADFALRDIDSTFSGFAGADYDLQDALSFATEKVSEKRTDKDGQLYYDVSVVAPDVTYLSCITVSRGKVYALFVKTPTKLYEADRAKYRSVVDSFQLLNQED